MNKKREELEKERAKVSAELEQYRHRGQRLENRLRYCEAGERRKRTHRLITRGAAVESVAPDVRGMGERAFFLLMEQVFALPEVVSLVRRSMEQMEDN